jgi:hypothetical protein
MSDRETKVTGELAFAMAELARRCIGPEGTVVRVAADDAPLVRSAFISRLAEAALKILDAPEPQS